jgi:Uma2 family endonuclease
MAANPTPHFSVEQYHAFLETGAGPVLEYWDGLILDMSGGTPQHVLIADNVSTALKRALAGGPCRAFGEGPAVDTPTLATFRLPDCTVVCGKPIFKTPVGSSIGVITNPVLIVEVLSPTSAGYDHGRKFEAYKTLPTFREYLLIEQTMQLITHWKKTDDVWTARAVTEGVLALESIGCELRMADVYEGV